MHAFALNILIEALANWGPRIIPGLLLGLAVLAFLFAWQQLQ